MFASVRPSIKSQKTFALIAALAVSLVDASVANATCEAQGKVNRLRRNSGGEFCGYYAPYSSPALCHIFRCSSWA